MKFEIRHNDKFSKARLGELHTDHGIIPTPIFMPVGTAASVKGVHQRELQHDINAKIILANSYHLFLRPGLEIIKQSGGVHGFNGWKRPILTDSGGYQVYSLAKSRKISEHGVTFRSHIDGSKHLFTPENVIDTQRILGSDIIMAFDECTPYPCEKKYAKTSMEMTHRWLERCCERVDNTLPLYEHKQSLFPIVQGSTYEDLRKHSAEVISSKEREGNAIGGLSVGEPAEVMYKMTELVCEILPKDKPRYLMGVGTPANLLECITLGVDMFDCVLPTRNARHGILYTSDGIINVKNKKWKNDFSAIDVTLGGYVSENYSKAYLSHLIRSNELLGAQIASVHNLTFYLFLMKTARKKIKEGVFYDWKNMIIPKIMQRL